MCRVSRLRSAWSRTPRHVWKHDALYSLSFTRGRKGWVGRSTSQSGARARQWRCCAPRARCHHFGRIAIPVAGSAASLMTAKTCAEKGFFTFGNVKGAHKGFPKQRLVENARARGVRATTTTSFTTSAREVYFVLGSADMDKKPMALIRAIRMSAEV